MYKKHGEVFTIPLAHKNMTFVIGPHASPHFFNATDDKMSQTEVRSRAGSTGGCRLQGGRGRGQQKQAKPCRRSSHMSPPLPQHPYRPHCHWPSPFVNLTSLHGAGAGCHVKHLPNFAASAGRQAAADRHI